MSEKPLAFIVSYVWRHRGSHFVVLLSVIAAATASVGARYSMKWLVDAISAGPGEMATLWLVVAVFTLFVGADNLLWRVAGWAAASTFPRVGCELRLDLFKHLLGQSARYFGDRFTGALANRITAGVILASLILGASLLMRIQTRFTLFGYPALAIICFLAAAAGGIWLLFSIFFQDEKIKKKKKL